jgi:sugar phosphate isomerase/epimerase
MPEALPLAVQLYSLRNELEKDLKGTIERVAAKGYAGVEPYFSPIFEQVAAACQEFGLKASSTHAPLPVGEDRAKAKAMVDAFNTSLLVVPAMPRERFGSASGVAETADLLRQGVEAAAEDGYELGYHNHDFEFVSVDGSTGYHLFIDQLDPRIFLELDTYWAQVGGQDVLKLVEELGTRLKLLHIKDGPGQRGDPNTAVGGGVMVWQPIFEAATSAEWAVVELDESGSDMLQDVEKSYDYLTQAGFAYGNA